MTDVILVKQRIGARAAEFVRGLFGERARDDGWDKWRIGGRGSLAIEAKDGALVFFSHEEGTGGDAIDLWHRERGGSIGDALIACAAWANVPSGSSVARIARPPRENIAGSQSREPATAPPPLKGSDLAEAAAASERLAGDAELCARIAEERGWRAETIRALCFEPALGWHDGKLAFIYPTGLKLRWMEAGRRQIVWHRGKPWLWREPLDARNARRVFLTEGETDAIALLDAGAEADGKTRVVALPSASWGKSTAEIWRERFRGSAVTLCFDADDAGQRCTEFVGNVLRGIAVSVRALDWKQLAA